MPQPSSSQTLCSAKKYNLHLKGFVGGYDFDRDYVDFVLGKNAGKPVNVLIDSLGGSLATALSISSAFKLHGDVTVHFVGMNASAATIASLGAKRVSIDTNAMYLVHKCSQAFFEWSQLNADQMADLIAELGKAKADLDKLDCNVAAMYAAKCKKDPKALLDLMKVGGWLTAKEAKEWGFVDEITDEPEDVAPRLTDSTASALAAAGIPIPHVPVAEKDNAFSRFLATLSSLFSAKAERQADDKGATPTTTPEIAIPNATPAKMSSIQLPQICAALAQCPLTFTDDTTSVNLSVEQLAILEKKISDQADAAKGHESAVKAKDDEIAALKARVAELEKAPADDTTTVVEDSKKPESPATPIDAFAASVRSAREIYDQLPQ